MLGTTPAPRTELLNVTPLRMASNASSSSLARYRRYPLPGKRLVGRLSLARCKPHVY